MKMTVEGASYGVPLVVALGVVLLDQATKALVVASLDLHDSVPLIDGFLDLVHVRNPGAAFSLFARAPEWFRGPFFIVVTVAAIVGLLYVSARLGADERWMRVALGAVLGGAVGNLVDRLLYGEVVDFIDVHVRGLHWPAFNVADSSITVAVVAVLAHSLLGRRTEPG